MGKLKQFYLDEIKDPKTLEPCDEMYLTQDEIDARDLDEVIKQSKEENLIYQMEHEYERHC